MCEICNGKSEAEVLSGLATKVRHFGWALQAVTGPDPTEVPWVYTVGLSSGFGHPDLVWMGGDIVDGAHVLNQLGNAVRLGARFGPGHRVMAGAEAFDLSPVHDVHVERGLVAMCDAYYSSIGHRPVVPGLLQVTRHEAKGRGEAPLLSGEGSWVPSSHAGNRAARRARRRHLA